MKLTKPVAIGAGVTVGAVQSYILREYIDFPIPVVSDYLGSWGMMSSLGNILIGGIAFGIAQFTEIIKKDVLKNLVKVYGLTNIAGGIVNGVAPKTPMPLAGGVATLSYGRDGFYTPEYYPYFQGRFLRRPASKARGFASDVTRQPMAAIPTKIEYNKILF